MIYKCVSGYTGPVMVYLGETSVDYHKTATGLYRGLSLEHTHGNVPVDYMAMIALDTELIEYAVAHVGIVAQDIVPPLWLLLYLLVIEKVTLERGHSRLSEKG